MAGNLDVDSIIERLLNVRGQQNNRTVQLAEGEIRSLCAAARCVPGHTPGPFAGPDRQAAAPRGLDTSRSGAPAARRRVARARPRRAGPRASVATLVMPSPTGARERH